MVARAVLSARFLRETQGHVQQQYKCTRWQTILLLQFTVVRWRGACIAWCSPDTVLFWQFCSIKQHGQYSVAEALCDDMQVRVFHMNPQGIVMVKFKTDDAAAKCLEVMEGRYFGCKKVSAHMWDGITNYHVKKKESAEEQQARLEKFSAQIEGQVEPDAEGQVEPDAAIKSD